MAQLKEIYRIPNTPSTRSIQLVDVYALGSATEFVAATIHRHVATEELEKTEAIWSPAREAGFAHALREGRHAEHRHWDWRRKIDSLKLGRHCVIGIHSEENYQGLMAVLTAPRQSRMIPDRGPVLYVDYIEAATWNLKDMIAKPRFFGIGTRMIAEAVLLSNEMGLLGRIGLHALPQAEEFYRDRCRMTRIGLDDLYYDLPYFEYTGEQATRWLASLKLG